MEKTMVITGGTKGIGRALVERFAQEGFQVLSCSRNQDDLDSLKSELESSHPGARFYGLVADMSDAAGVRSMIDYVSQKLQSVDVLINNAGVFLPGEISSEDEGNLETMINTNLYSAYRLTRGLLPGMMERKNGYVFNICSIASLAAYPQGSSYTISKFALLGFSKSLRSEMQDKGVRVTAILPGAVKTPSWDGVDIPEERFIKPQDIANSVWSAYNMSETAVVEEILIRPQLGDI